MARPRLLFVATEDWFFASHFLPMARAARELDFDVAVIARERNHRRVIEAAGVRLIALEAAAAAARMAAIAWLRGAIDGPQVRFLFENPDDPVTLGLDPADAAKVAIVGGAGVDPLILMPEPMPPAPPLKVALVARLLWSKGVDLAVEAIRLARAQGARVELTLHGAPDPSNPRAIPEETLRQWAARPGIDWAGPTRDIEGVWRQHHLCILPSRGGEGLPRTILEAAACGRPILTTDVPGCRSFVRDGQDGMVVPANDAAALAQALIVLSRAPALAERMGASARARLIDGHTERDVMNAVKALYRNLLARPTMDIVA
ncbi:MAG: hypothetical protein B7Z14_10865 [Bosea sp. 32-68-6]|nr:MAG: hypothetical protein B7Z14_10865 [Bosea sp. 32-68-6]